MSLKATNKENSPLLNNNTSYQAYNDEMKQSQSMSKSSKSSLLSHSNSNHIININNDKNKKNPTKSKSKSKRVNTNDNKRSRAKSRTTIRIDRRNNKSNRNKPRRNNNDQIRETGAGAHSNNNNNDTRCDKCLGKLFVYLEENGCIEKTQVLYAAILLIAGVVALCLILSRIFNNKIFHSSIFKSDSPPLLLAANIVMMLSYGIEDFLWLRVCLSSGCLLFALWAVFSDPILLDTAMFNTVMFLLNVRHAMKLWYQQRYIEFDPEYERIYQNVFKAYLNRVDFQILTEDSYVRTEKKGEIFKRKDDEVTSLCCLVKGRMSVVREVEFEPVSMIKNQKLTRVKSFNNSHLKYKSSYDYDDDNVRNGGGASGGNKDDKTSMMHSLMDDADDSDIEKFLSNPHFVNLCHENQFIEAPQWVHANLRPDGDRFTVSFVAVEDCEYIKWPKEKLIEKIDNNPAIYHALNGVLGLHTARALLKSRKYTKIQDDFFLRSDNNSNNNSMTRYKTANLSRKNTLNNDADIDEDEQDDDQEEDDDDNDHHHDQQQDIDDDDEDDNDDNDI